jgi:hypothetical protein
MPDVTEEKTRKSSVRTACILADIRTEYLPNKTQGRYPSADLLARTSGKNGKKLLSPHAKVAQKDGRSSSGPLPRPELILVAVVVVMNSHPAHNQINAMLLWGMTPCCFVGGYQPFARMELESCSIKT